LSAVATFATSRDQTELLVGDAEEMDRERAQTHLRHLAETELRDAVASPADTASDRWHSSRLALVTEALCAVDAIDARTAEQIQTELDLALSAWQLSPLNPSNPGPGALPPAERGQLERLLQVQLARTARAATVSTGGAAQKASQLRPWRIIPIGQVIRIGGAAGGELCLLSYVQTADSARFTVVGWIPELPGARDQAPELGVQPQQRLPSHHRLTLDRLTAEDDAGTRYNLRFIGGGIAGRLEWQGVLDLRPGPSHGIRWLDLRMSPDDSPIRVNFTAQLVSPDVTVTQRMVSAGELLLDVIAARLLAIAATFPQDTPEQLAAGKPRLLPHPAYGLGDIVAALRTADALSSVSAVPGQLSRLCAQLGIVGHGIGDSASTDMPERWLSILRQYEGRGERPGPAPRTCSATTIELPPIDDARIAVLGLHQGDNGTVLHLQVQAGRVTPENDWEYSRGVGPLPVLWIRDGANRWHATRTSGWNRLKDDEVVLRLAIVPPLEAETPWIEVLAAGQSAEVRAVLRLRWH
jgi:hypothetical protein